MLHQLTFTGIPGLPIIRPGDDLAALLVSSLHESGITLRPGDVLVITSKVVSKAEGRLLDLRTLTPSARAVQIAGLVKKDPRFVEAVLRESVDISRTAPHALIVTHRLGFTSNSAGIDYSNLDMGADWVLLLPEDPDRSARDIRARLEALTGVAPGIIISDTHGRPFRLGNINVAIGAAGILALWDQRGEVDLFGRTMEVTVTAPADEIAAAAGLVTGQRAEGIPAVHVRGLRLPAGDLPASAINRAKDQDLYR